MKKRMVFLGMGMLLISTLAHAQVTVPEPESLDSYSILTSDSTYEVYYSSEVQAEERGDSARLIQVFTCMGGGGLKNRRRKRLAAEERDATKDIRLIARDEDTEGDPRERFGVVKFGMPFLEMCDALWRYSKPSVNFYGQKYGEHSYLLTIPRSGLKPGFYGIFRVNSLADNRIRIITFNVK